MNVDKCECKAIEGVTVNQFSFMADRLKVNWISYNYNTILSSSNYTVI